MTLEEEKYNSLLKIYKSQVLSMKDNFSYTLIISLTNACNLNCTNCQAFCTNGNNDFTTLEELKYSIPILKNKLKNCLNVTLFGGEPLLNPEIKEICKFLRQEYSNIPIQIFTNGLLLSNWKEEDYLLMKNLDINFLITLYPLKQAIDIVQEQEKKLKKYNINLEIHGTRPYFCKTDYNSEGLSNGKIRFFQCCHCDFPPTFYLHRDKLFKCGVEPGFSSINLPIDKDDYLDIKELEINKVLDYCSKPLKACNYCGFLGEYGSDEIFVWHQQKDLKSEYFTPLMDLYINDYNSYFKFCHDCAHIIPILKNEYFLSKHADEGYCSSPLQIYLNRFFDGIGDVLIPFDKNVINKKEFLYNFRDQLQQQNNYLKINFYFISLDGNKKAKEIMYSIFTPTSCDIEGNFYFLEELNKNKIEETFFNNSYLQNKFILNYMKHFDYLKDNQNYLLENLGGNKK